MKDLNNYFVFQYEWLLVQPEVATEKLGDFLGMKIKYLDGRTKNAVALSPRRGGGKGGGPADDLEERDQQEGRASRRLNFHGGATRPLFALCTCIL